jgi:hypothetical protein
MPWLVYQHNPKQPGNKTTDSEINIGNYGQQRYAAGFRTPLQRTNSTLVLPAL